MNPQVGFSYSAYHVIDDAGAIDAKSKRVVDPTPSVISPNLHIKIALYTGSIAGNIANVTLTKGALNQVGPFDEGMKYAGDFDMWVRIAKSYHIGRIKEALLQLRAHKRQLSQSLDYSIFQIKEDMIIFAKLKQNLSEKEKQYARKTFNYRKLPYYFSIGLNLLRNQKKEHALAYYKFMIRHFGFFKVVLLAPLAKVIQLIGLHNALAPSPFKYFKDYERE